jgi:formate-dependent nitrite reductase membrane component NrfD
MSQRPSYTLRAVGLASVAFAGLGLWYNGSTLRAQFAPDAGAPYFFHAFYTMSAVCIFCYLTLATTGIQLLRLRTAWVRVLATIVVLELVFMLGVPFLFMQSAIRQSVASASGVAMGGLMFQVFTLFPIWAPLLARWAARRINSSGAIDNPFAEQDRIARPSDWLWAAISGLIVFALASILLSMLWANAFLRTTPNYLPIIALAIGIVNALASVRQQRKRRRKKLDRQRQDRLGRGVCPRCAYSLTGNSSGICPECGTRVTSVATMAAAAT